MGAAWELDGYAVQIGIRVLDGHPESFYRLSREQQVNTLAVLLVERMKEDPKARKDWLKDAKVTATPEALEFWASVGFGGGTDAG